MRPEYVVPCRTTVRTRIVSKYLAKKQWYRQMFRRPGIGRLSATTDLWTSGNKYSMMSVTSTWLDEKFEQQQVVLAHRRVLGKHSGANIARIFHKVLQEYGIENKVSKFL